LDRGGAVDLLVRLPAGDGAAADRYSPYNRWSIVVSREAIETLLGENGHRVGRLVDLEPLERGATGRLVRLKAVGSEGSVTLRGLDIRWNLGTRENLFFIDRITGPDGSNRAYRFTGRGWGHGVGLCQVGAVGLAEAGADFLEILQHYYPGIVIRPVRPEAGP
jgi:stage II sporulation protein D